MADNDNVISTLNGLIETCRDGQNGFQTAAEGVTNSELKTLFHGYAQQRAQFVGDLQTEVTRWASPKPASSRMQFSTSSRIRPNVCINASRSKASSGRRRGSAESPRAAETARGLEPRFGLGRVNPPPAHIMFSTLVAIIVTEKGSPFDTAR